MTLEAVRQIGIVGTGLLGTSVGLALKAAGFTGRIVGSARRAATVEAALSRGGIDAAAASAGEAAAESELLIVAVPLSAFDAVLAEIADSGHERLVVTDVGSTKRSVLAAAQRHLGPAGEAGRFVGSHPMAGSEHAGPEAARADLCAGKPCIVTPTDETDAAALERVEAMWRAIGMRVIRMSAEAHDAQAATVSHVPHALAVLLIELAEQRGGWELASTGFAGATRLASSNPPMRADILAANRAYVAEALRALRGSVDELIALLEAGEMDGVKAKLEAAKARRDAWAGEIAANEHK